MSCWLVVVSIVSFGTKIHAGYGVHLLDCTLRFRVVIRLLLVPIPSGEFMGLFRPA